MATTNTFDDAEFEQAYLIIAKIIRDHGKKYLPIFKRMHDEKVKREVDRELTKTALQASLSAINGENVSSHADGHQSKYMTDWKFNKRLIENNN